MSLIKNPFGKSNLLVWRTESIFFNEERRKLAGEWNLLRFTALPYPKEPHLTNSSLKGKLPYPDHCFDSVYSFHVFEHLSYEEGIHALRELHRVLKPGGICRISTPDLEFFAREYVQQLDVLDQEGTDARQDFRYEWSCLNVIDQAVRKKSGGRMAEVLRANNVDKTYLKYLNGDSLNFVVDPNHKQSMDSPRRPTYFDGSPAPLVFRMQKLVWAVVRRVLLRLSPGLDVEIQNERNRWLYDRISLAKVFKAAGFSEIAIQEYNTSQIEDWERYDYDSSLFGKYPLEPSLFMEGKK